MNPIGLVGVALGAFCLLGAYSNGDWFFTNGKARPVVNTLGRPGARVFYTLLGTAFFAVGVLHTFGVA
jgi:hypothetical protein